ncbi:MAG: nuclear transport factor 2 family protein [Longimicrobiales bacterium]
MNAIQDATMSRLDVVIKPDTLADIHAVVDALYRFAAGQDLRVRELFESAFSLGAVVDFTQPAACFGISLPAFTGRQAVVDTIMDTTAALVTTHSVTNPRVSVEGDQAHMMALVEAQHVLREDPSRYLLLKNFYTVDCREAASSG